MASENVHRHQSGFLNPKVVPPLVLLKQVTALLKTWSRVPIGFLTTGLTFGITSKVINPQLVIEQSRLALRFSLNTPQVFNWWLEPKLLVVVPVLMAGQPQNSSFSLSKFSTWFRHFFFLASRLVKFLCSSWSQGWSVFPKLTRLWTIKLTQLTAGQSPFWVHFGAFGVHVCASPEMLKIGSNKTSFLKLRE